MATAVVTTAVVTTAVVTTAAVTTAVVTTAGVTTAAATIAAVTSAAMQQQEDAAAHHQLSHCIGQRLPSLQRWYLLQRSDDVCTFTV